MLASWVGQRYKRKYQYDLADSAHTAPGWRVVGDPFFTCITPADRAADHVILKWIHSFAPEAIPIWRKQRYLPPGSVKPVMATHFGIATHVKTPNRSLAQKYVEMPVKANHPVPNQLEFILELRDETLLHHGGPGASIPIDMRLYNHLRADYNITKTAKQLADEAAKRAADKKARENASLAEEREYIRRDRDKFIQKQLDAPGDIVAAFRQWKIKRQLENRRKFQIVSPKPFIYMKGVW